ncbi:MAG: SIMPL domain-containing protein [Patescibacteria group bacterium]
MPTTTSSSTGSPSMKPGKPFRGVIALLAIALIIFVGVETRNALQQYNYIGTNGRDTISIDGYGKVTAQPDLAMVDLGVTTQGAAVKDAQTQNTQKMNAIIAALKAMSIADADIQTSNYSISPNYDYTNGTQKLTGYTISQEVTVKVRNLDSLGDVLSQAGNLGANQVNGVSFTIDDPTSIQAQARDKALADARTKAEDVAKTLGLTIVKAVTFSESSGSTPPVPLPFAMDASAGIAGKSVPSPSVQSGSLDVESNVTVTFEVH